MSTLVPFTQTPTKPAFYWYKWIEGGRWQACYWDEESLARTKQLAVWAGPVEPPQEPVPQWCIEAATELWCTSALSQHDYAAIIHKHVPK